MSINIWLATWNCENQAPDNTMLNDFMVNDVNALPPAQQPDLIVVGLQEADVNSTFDRKFVSQRLAKPGRLGNTYTHIASSYTVGITKGKKNYLQVGVLCKNDPNTTITNMTTNTYRDGLEGKGGGWVSFTYTNPTQLANPLRLGFVNAHLDSKNAIKQGTEITELLRSITGQPPAATQAQIRTAIDNNFEALFFMGDLNYRIVETTAGGHIRLRHAPGIGAQPVTTVQDMINMIKLLNAPNGLENLDSLYRSSLVDPAAFGFTFPSVAHLLPTYKRDYHHVNALHPCKLLSIQFAAHTPLSDNHIRGCYFSGLLATAPAPFSAGRNAFEMGWLDRIGYRATPAANLQPPVMEAKDDIVLSDHTPVIMKVTVG